MWEGKELMAYHKLSAATKCIRNLYGKYINKQSVKEQVEITVQVWLL